MSHESGTVIIQRAVTAAKTAVTGDNKWASLIIALAGVIGGGWLF